jgi:hypothetical protein
MQTMLSNLKCMSRKLQTTPEEEAVEPQMKRSRVDVETSNLMQVHVVDLRGEEFHVNIERGERVRDTKERILKQQNYELKLEELRLVLNDEVLDDSVILAETSANDGDNLTLIKRERVGLMQLCVDQISDNTQWHGRHKFALRSEQLKHEVEKIEVTVGDFQDQGWGGCQARLFIYLHDPSTDMQVAGMKVFGPLRTAEYDEKKHRRSPSCTIGEEEPIVSLAQPGMVYKLKYQCGGGGGHSITVKNWYCKIFPKGWTTNEVDVKQNGSVNLDNTSRLGPDKQTGKWELVEPPYE